MDIIVYEVMSLWYTVPLVPHTHTVHTPLPCDRYRYRVVGINAKTSANHLITMTTRTITVFTKYGSGEALVERLRRMTGAGAQVKSVSVDTVTYDSATNKPFLNDELVKSLQDAEIMITDPWLVFPIMDRLPNLKWMQGTWAGIDGIFKHVDSSMIPPKFIYTRLGGAFTHQMAQYVIGYILSNERHMLTFHKAQQIKKWIPVVESEIHYRKFDELTIGILGVGDIGSQVANSCKSFGMKTVGLVSRDLPADKRSPDIDEYRLTSDLHAFLTNCDYVCNVLPSTPKTKGLLSGDVFSHCTKKPVFINIGRGDVTSEDTIVNAIKMGWISRAVLDVFEKEPLPDDSPLWTMPEVTITPHCSGMTFDYSIADTFSENYQHYVNGQPLKYVIDDWKRGY